MLHCPTCGKEYPADVTICPEDNSSLQADPTIAGDAPVDRLLNQVIDDKYRIEARLGIGGMGTVYRARHVLIDRVVALKVLNPRLVEDEDARERFRREAKAAGRLQHVNAVAVTDFGETADGIVYIVMELLEGRTLREIIAREAPLETARAVSIILQAAAAVAAAHDAGIIHRDLKPANIFIVQRPDVPVLVKVLDFGIAKLAIDSLEDDEQKALTQVGAMLGTPRYMSPEQFDGLALTPAADVYSLGVILYEMLTGTAPFTGSTPIAIGMKHAANPPRPLREIVASVPGPLEEVVLHALEKHPQDRPADANAFRQELLETADRLGLEHAALISLPDMKAVRDVAVESPSGRLVVDLSRLRENRVLTTSAASDVTLASGTVNGPNGSGSTVQNRVANPSFPRVNVTVSQASPRVRFKPIAILSTVVLALVLITVALFAFRRAPQNPPINNSTVVASPSPTLEASPSPSPSPSPRHAVTKPKPTGNKEASGKDDSIFGKIKRIFKKH